MLSRNRLQGIALATRKAIEYGVDSARWQQDAPARAAEHELGSRQLEQLASLAPRAGPEDEAEVVRLATARLSGREGLTGQHNTFARRHAVAEFAGEFDQGAALTAIERLTSSYLQHGTVARLGRFDGEHRFSTCDLLAPEHAIIDGARRSCAVSSSSKSATIPARRANAHQSTSIGLLILAMTTTRASVTSTVSGQRPDHESGHLRFRIPASRTGGSRFSDASFTARRTATTTARRSGSP
jgi:hypothetical protein